ERLHELLQQDFTRGDQVELACHFSSLDHTMNTSVIIHDLDVDRVTVLPAETNAPLVVHADAVLPGAVAFQSLQPVARRCPQIEQRLCPVQQEQLAPDRPLYVPEPRDRLVAKYALRVAVPEVLDHGT